MAREIRITAGSVEAVAELNDSRTADLVWDALPIKARGTTWGEEIYFGIPINMDEEPDAEPAVEIGDIAFWPPGNAFCIFFGPTPASTESEIRAASPVNVMGKLKGDPKVFKSFHSGEQVVLDRA